jgi:hypothetical protein
VDRRLGTHLGRSPCLPVCSTFAIKAVLEAVVLAGIECLFTKIGLFFKKANSGALDFLGILPLMQFGRP